MATWCALILQRDVDENPTKMVWILLFVWMLAWTPYAVMSVYVMFFNANGLSPILGLIPNVCCKTSAGLNVMLYGLR